MDELENIVIQSEKPDTPDTPAGEKEQAAAQQEQTEKPKKGKNPQQAWDRMKREMKELKEQVKIGQDRQAYLETELFKARNTVQQQPVSQQFQLPKDPDDFVQRQHLEPALDTIVQRLNTVEQNTMLTRQQQMQQMCGIIDNNGRARFDDYDTVMARFSARWANPEVREFESSLIFSNPDPAGYAYRLAGGNAVDRKNGVKRKPAVVDEDDEPVTFAGQRSQSSESGQGLTFEAYVNAPEEQKKLIRKKLGDEGITKLRLDYYKRNNIPYGGI